MKTFTLKVLLVGLSFLFLQSLRAQKILDPTDTLVNYDSTHPPVQPPYGKIGKWVRTPSMDWSTTAYKCYIYQGSDFRLHFPQTYQPNDGKKYPIMVFYHGDGEEGPIYDNETTLRNGMLTFHKMEVQGVFDGYIIVMQNQYGWGPAQFWNLQNLIDTLVQEYGGDPYRVIQNGLSGGGQGVWQQLVLNPTYFAAAIPMSAALIQDATPADVNILKFTPIWNLDGGLDNDPPPYEAQLVASNFQSQGANYIYTNFTTLGHGTWDSTWEEPNFWPYVNSAYLSNPWPLFDRTMFCPGENVNVTLGIVPGLDGYQWRRNDTILAGAVTDSIIVTQPGTYDARVLRGQNWSDWSHTPVVISSGLPPLTFAVTQPTCAVATGQILINAPPTDTLYYSLNGTNFSTKGEFDSLSPGIYNITIKNSICAAAVFTDTIKPQPVTPPVPTITVTQPSCSSFNGEGEFVITVTDTTFKYSINNGHSYGTATKFYPLPQGEYLVTAQSTGGCVSAKDTVVIGPSVTVPAEPSVTVTQASCTSPAGTITINTSPADTGLVYSINGSSYQSGNVFKGLAAGTYPVTAKNTAGCPSPADTVIIDSGSVTPSAPTLSLVQPTCTVGTGTITVTAPLNSGSISLAYSINGSAFQPSPTFSAVVPGSYTVTVKNLSGGCVSSSTQAVIQNQPTAPAAPAVAVTQPTCTTGSGTIIISAADTSLAYSINGSTYLPQTTFGNLISGSYPVTAENSAGCVSSATTAVVNTFTGGLPTPTFVITQPTCTVAMGSINITSPIDSGYTYRIQDSANFQPVPLFTGVQPGTYYVTVKGGANGCLSSPATAIVLPSPALPVPTVAVTQATCMISTGSITVTSPVDSGLLYSIDGANYQADTVITPVSPGTYQVTVKDNAGCVSAAAPAQILAPPTSCSSCVAASHSPFNGFMLSANPGYASTLWFNLHTQLNSDQLTANGDYLLFSGGTLSFSGIVSTVDSTVALPSGEIMADNTVTIPSTSFNSTTNTWVTRVPLGYASNDVFVTGAAITSGDGFMLSGTSNATMLSGNWSSDKAFVSEWWYGLACYQPTFSTAAVGSVNADDGVPIGGHSSGTPNNQTGGLVSGGSGNGGSNYTGDFSTMDVFTACVVTLPVPPKVELTVYPNPYLNTVYFNITTSVSGTGSLEFYNLLGQELGVIEETQFSAGIPQTITVPMTIGHNQPVVYVFRIGSKKVEGTLLPEK
jgi:predicted esterase